MSSEPHAVRVEIEYTRLREATAAILDAIRVLPIIRSLGSNEMVLVQAYILGVVMAASDTALGSVDGLKEMIVAGMDDYQRVESADESHADGA